MKVLVFHIGAERYGLRLAAIERVLPAVTLKALPLTPPWVAGLLDLHGTPVPVIDLAQLAEQRTSAWRFDTRIVVVNYHTGAGTLRSLGLLAEQVQGIRQLDPAALADGGVRAPPFLGQVAADGGAMLQLVEIDHLLPLEVRSMLFPEALA